MASKNNSRNEPHVIGVFGATGSGKSVWIKRLLEELAPRRLMVWDPMREYGHLGNVCAKLGPMAAQISSAKRGAFTVVFQPATDDKQRAKQFDVFCGLAYAAGNLTMLVEELKFVTKPSWAPMRWAEVTLTGRHRGLFVIGVSQRPASIDKDFFGNCTLIHCGALGYPEDVNVMAKSMRVTKEELDALPDLHFIEYRRRTKEKTAGVITFP